MSNATEGQVTGDGGTRCFGVDVSTACVANVARTFVVIATDGACSDGREYPFKAIIFDDRKAIAVRCITDEDAARLWRGREAGTADVREVSAEQAAAVASIITCPPVQQPADADSALDVEQKLDQLTAWAQPLFAAPLTAAAEKHSAA
jgi:hypothetical protein